MTQDEIIEMAREAGIGWGEGIGGMPDFLEAFAKLVADKAFQNGYEKGIAGFNEAVSLEREACAKVCDVLAYHPEFASDVTKLAAMAIRARGEA